MKVTVFMLIAVLMTISIGASCDIFSTTIENNAGTLDFGGGGSAILAGELIFPNITWGSVQGSWDLEVDVNVLSAPDLGIGMAYTQFLSLNIQNAGGVSFDNATLTMLVIPEVSVGDSANLYFNDGSGWTLYPDSLLQNIGGDVYVLQATGLNHLSEWGGWGDDPIIPDPATTSIIACGLLLLGGKSGWWHE